MADTGRIRTWSFTVGDFFNYLVPGALVLGSVVVLTGHERVVVEASASLGPVLIGTILSYTLGQLMYALTYPIRRIITRVRPDLRETKSFKKRYIECIEKHVEVSERVILRYRALARGSLALVLPSVLCLSAIAVRVRAFPGRSVLAILLIPIVAAAFTARFIRYMELFREAVDICAPESAECRD